MTFLQMGLPSRSELEQFIIASENIKTDAPPECQKNRASHFLEGLQAVEFSLTFGDHLGRPIPGEFRVEIWKLAE